VDGYCACLDYNPNSSLLTRKQADPSPLGEAETPPAERTGGNNCQWRISEVSPGAMPKVPLKAEAPLAERAGMESGMPSNPDHESLRSLSKTATA